MANKISLTLVGGNEKPAKIHHLVKAPANTTWALAKQQSWDANHPATVYVTPETVLFDSYRFFWGRTMYV